jgi:hypothetical protein
MARISGYASGGLTCPVSAPARGSNEIRIDQARRRTARGRRCALRERGEDAVDPFAVQRAIDVHADGITRIVCLSPCRRGNKSHRKRNNREDEPDHANPSTVKNKSVGFGLHALAHLQTRQLARRVGGAGGIRTLDRALQPYNGLANRRLQPLGHSSDRADMPDAGVSRKRQIQGRRITGLATPSFRRMFEVETAMRSRAFRLFRGLPFVSADQAIM